MTLLSKDSLFHPWNNISLLVLNSQNYTNEVNVWEIQWISQVKKITNQFFVNILVSYRAATGRKYLNNNNTVSHGGVDQTQSSPRLALCSYKQ